MAKKSRKILVHCGFASRKTSHTIAFEARVGDGALEYGDFQSIALLRPRRRVTVEATQVAASRRMNLQDGISRRPHCILLLHLAGMRQDRTDLSDVRKGNAVDQDVNIPDRGVCRKVVDAFSKLLRFYLKV